MDNLDTITSYRDELSAKRARRRANTERVAKRRAQGYDEQPYDDGPLTLDYQGKHSASRRVTFAQ